MNETKKKFWPKGSLERVLARDFPGCTSALEAFDKRRSLSSNSQVPLLREETEEEKALKEAVKEIEEAQKDLDMDKISLPMRDRLAKMPLTTVIEIGLWKDLWLSTIEKVRW